MTISYANELFRKKKYKEALNEYLKYENTYLKDILDINISICKKRIDEISNLGEQSYSDKLDLSVIVPIYNVEKFLDKALFSLKNQNLKNIEFILINDGSTDGSLEIAKKFTALDERFKLIDLKKNGGYGRGCNIGLNLASGDYVVIFEPDDFIDPEGYEIAVSTARKKSADVVFFGWRDLYEDGITKESNYKKYLKNSGVTIGEIIDIKKNPKQINTQPTVWSFICSREFLEKNRINFLETPGAFFQDISFYHNVLIKSNRVVYLDGVYYNYRHHANQSVASKDKGIPVLEYKRILSSLNQDYDFLENSDKEKVIYHSIMRLISSIDFHINKRSDKNSARVYYKDIQNIVNEICINKSISKIVSKIYKQSSIFRILVDCSSFDGFLAAMRSRFNTGNLEKIKDEIDLSKKPKISIGVPVFETSKYVEKCIASLLNQSLTEIEIIIIDDASKDNSLNLIFNKYSNENRVRIYKNKINSGVGSSRNNCINLARADYILLVDSDDWVSENFCEELYNAAIKTKAEIVECNVKKTYEDDSGKLSNFIDVKSQYITSPFDYYINGNVDPCVYNKMYKKSIFLENNIYFPEYVYHQDIATNFRLFSVAKNYASTSLCNYYYFQRKGSAVAHYSDKHIDSIGTLFNLLNRFISINNIKNAEKYLSEEIFLKWCVQRNLRRIVNYAGNDYSRYLSDSVEMLRSISSPVFIANAIEKDRLSKIEKSFF